MVLSHHHLMICTHHTDLLHSKDILRIFCCVIHELFHDVAGLPFCSNGVLVNGVEHVSTLNASRAIVDNGSEITKVPVTVGHKRFLDLLQVKKNGVKCGMHVLSELSTQIGRLDAIALAIRWQVLEGNVGRHVLDEEGLESL